MWLLKYVPDRNYMLLIKLLKLLCVDKKFFMWLMKIVTGKIMAAKYMAAKVMPYGDTYETYCGPSPSP